MYTWLINLITKKIFHMVTEKDVLRENRRGELFFKGKKLSDAQVRSLVESARELKANHFFKMLMDDVVFSVDHELKTKVSTTEGLRAIKAELHLIDVIRRKVDNISKREL